MGRKVVTGGSVGIGRAVGDVVAAGAPLHAVRARRTMPEMATDEANRTIPRPSIAVDLAVGAEHLDDGREGIECLDRSRLDHQIQLGKACFAE